MNNPINNVQLGQIVYHKEVYNYREPLKVKGITEDKLLLEGDFSGGMYKTVQSCWMDKRFASTEIAMSDRIEQLGMIKAYNADCLQIMQQYPDKYFDLAIVDPPYGIDTSLGGCGSRKKKYDRRKKSNWDSQIPSEDYWQELFRISKNQIIWGMNYYQLPPCQHFIVWDKKQPIGVSFAMAELCWTSFKGTSKIYYSSSNGQDNRIHPTQKPVKLYEWLLTNYAKQGDRILDTHGGSMSHAIACHNLGFDLTIIEKDKDYYDAAIKRIKWHQRQQILEF